MREFKRVVIEGLVIATIGVGIALVANAKNPDGLLLGKNHFAFARVGLKPNGSGQAVATSAAQGTQPATDKQDDSGTAQIKAMVIANGLNPTDHAEVVRLFRDPGRERGLYVFLDARNDDDYAAGHIPGAYHLYAFLNDEELRKQFFDEFIPVAVGAEKVVVYCNGGHCDDSVQVALELPQRGLDPAKVLVDVDGMTAWRKFGLPIERGTRLSGDIMEGKK